MGLEGLKAVLAKYEADPEHANGFASGGYSVDYDKIWRGDTVIGYTNPKKGQAGGEMGGNSDVPTFLPTSNTTAEEGHCFASSAAVAPPEPVSPPMSITSPEGAESEEQPPPEQAPVPGQEPAPGPPSEIPSEPGGEGVGTPPPSGEGEAKSLEELGAATPSKSPDHFERRRRESDPLGLSRETAPTRESLEVLASARLEETRRKYYNANASLQFDIEAKSVTGGESVCLYLLPIIRSEGKYEIYDYTVTKTSAIPSAYAVRQAVAASVAEAIPHVTVNRSQLEMIARRVYSAMKAAKDDRGGFNREESVTEAIDRYFLEDF